MLIVHLYIFLQQNVFSNLLQIFKLIFWTYYYWIISILSLFGVQVIYIYIYIMNNFILINLISDGKWAYFFFTYYYFSNVFIFNWRIIALQYCVGFCQTSTWISHRYTYVPSLLNPPPTSYPIKWAYFLKKKQKHYPWLKKKLHFDWPTIWVKEFIMKTLDRHTNTHTHTHTHKTFSRSRWSHWTILVHI